MNYSSLRFHAVDSGVDSFPGAASSAVVAGFNISKSCTIAWKLDLGLNKLLFVFLIEGIELVGIRASSDIKNMGISDP